MFSWLLWAGPDEMANPAHCPGYQISCTHVYALIWTSFHVVRVCESRAPCGYAREIFELYNQVSLFMNIIFAGSPNKDQTFCPSAAIGNPIRYMDHPKDQQRLHLARLEGEKLHWNPRWKVVAWRKDKKVKLTASDFLGFGNYHTQYIVRVWCVCSIMVQTVHTY